MNKKMRMFQALLIVAILLLQMIIPIVPSIAAGETITIQCKDKNFYNAIKEKLGEKVESASDEDLKLTALRSDVESIDTLDLRQDYSAKDAIKIEDISGIENFKGLTGLDLKNNQISDISKLSGLTNLTYLRLDNNQISDIRVLSGLTNLKSLDLKNNQISDISELKGLTNLKSLDLKNNQISDISELKGLTNLTDLGLSNNQISDIGAISGLTNLKYLFLGSNQISDISELKGLTNLIYLFLDNNQISDIGAISGLTNLTDLCLSNNQISNIGAISGLTNLTYLYLESNQISDISGLSGLTNLEYLNLDNDQISDIGAISGLTNLTSLYLSNNQISNISELKGLTNLTELYLSNNQISDISGLSGLTNLEYLKLDNNQISDINKLANLTKLGTLYLNENQISDITVLAKLTNLKWLNLSSNEIDNINALAKLSKIRVLYLMYNKISDISELSELIKQTNITNLGLMNQQLTIKTEDEVELPQIFKIAKDKDNLMYTADEYELENCELTADNTKVKLKEKGKNASVKIIGGKANGTTLNIVGTEEAQKTLESIKITTPPTKTVYTEGEKFNPEGMKVTATYSDETTEEVTDYIYTPTKELTTGDTTITVSYTENEITKLATQAITVKAEDPNAEKTIQFKDENLYNEIKSILGDKIKDYNDEELTIKAIKKDIEEINSIGPLREVDDISGIGNFTGLESLSLIDNNLSDISEVEKLTNLTHFSISHTQVEDIKAVSKLINLKHLNIETSKVSDISVLKDLVNLNELDLLQNNIENIDVVKNFKNLQILRFGENKVRDISAISELSNLEKLWISNNQISDANPIQKLPNLKYYGLENQQVTKYILKTQKEVELPPIFTQAKDKNSKIYTEKEYEFTNCKLNEDGTKVILTTVGENATVKISGGKADGTTLNIIAVDEIPKELTSIEIAIHPGKFIYTEGEDFDTTGLKVEAKYSDGSSKELKEGEYEIVDGKNLKLGQETVTIRYTEGEKTVETTHTIAVKAKEPGVEKTLSKIEITTPPTKTAYTEGEKFDKAGMKVIATYSDGTTKEVTDYTYTPAGELKTTDTAITVSYKEGEKTVEAKYTITVKAKPPVAQKTLESIKVTTAPTKTAYTEGEKFDKTGMKVIATYSDGTTKEVTDYTYTPAGELKTTDTAITVSYKEGEKTVEAKYTITVKAKPPVAQKTLESIKVTTAPTRTTYTEGEKFDKAGMKVIATYSDGTTKEIRNYAYTPAGELKTTDKTITVSYTENELTKTATQEITVVAKGNSGDEPGGETEKAKLDSIEIKEAPTKTVYTEGEKFDKTGMKVIAKYSDGTTKEIKNYAYTPAGALTKKDTTITVSYTENGVTKTDTQKIKIQNKDDGTGAKDKFPDTGAQIPIISGIVLMFAVAVASVVKIKRLTGI